MRWAGRICSGALEWLESRVIIGISAKKFPKSPEPVLGGVAMPVENTSSRRA